ncbi:MAG TPA: glycosyl hydrolase family 65 protein [Gemmatimonadaceae bacterium]|nr:glycosyl hydrolase family 65 protein [Gemmatimonadaceae bacterium]
METTCLAVLPAAPTTDPAWLLVEDGFNLAREHEIESLFAVANGYVGTRGSLAEGSPLSAPATFVAGVFDLPGGAHAVPELVVAPDWLRLCATVDGQQVRLENGEPLEHRRILDLRQGILWREWRHRDPTGRITWIHGLRLASLADRNVLLQSIMFSATNYAGRLHLEIPIEATDGEAFRDPTLSPMLVPVASSNSSADGAVDAPEGRALALRTAGTGVTVAFASATRLTDGQEIRGTDGTGHADAERPQQRTVEVEIGKCYRMDRIVVVCTSRDTDRPAAAAAAHLGRIMAEGGADRVVAAHVRAWDARWRGADVEIEGDAASQRALRFAGYHLISAVNPEDERVSVGARALTGHTYKGHVFWDTEIFMLPFYAFTHPPSARALLMYRHHTLPAARDKARALGYRGALFPWESAATGVEATPRVWRLPDGTVIRILTGDQEHHISADVAYAVWHYWRLTGDDEFLLTAGAELLLETARFWASRGAMGNDGRYHIREVIGPDEYHEGVDDDAYTNLMAQWNLERGAETARVLESRWPERWRELSRALALTADEVDEWRRIAQAMYTGFDPETGLYEQFRGYFGLEEIDLSSFEPRTAPLDVVLGWHRTQRSKVIKQADVVMALCLLWDRFPAAVREANFRYYEARTGHGSSLSPSVHALVAARLGDNARAMRYLRQTAEVDLANNMGNAAGGVHAAALGGLWQAVVLGFGGLRLLDDGLLLDPTLPPEWRALHFPAQWRGRQLRVAMSGDPLRVEVELEGEGGVPLALPGLPATVIATGRRYEAERQPAGWGPWRELVS